MDKERVEKNFRYHEKGETNGIIMEKLEGYYIYNPLATRELQRIYVCISG